MPVVSMSEILKPAFQCRYGVGAFNIFNDLTMEAVLNAAGRLGAPVIVQVSVKTAKQMGAKMIRLMFSEMADRVAIPTTLHLDHCPEISIIKECLEAGWNSVLFDGSKLPYEENLRLTQKVVAMARRYGASVEGELEAVKGVEDGVGSETEGPVFALDKALAFVRQTGIDSFAPAIGTAHGVYKAKPKINFDRVSRIVEAESVPLVLHGGTGLEPDVFQKLIARGAVKINISTQLKVTYADTYRHYLEIHPDEYDPLKLIGAVREELIVRIMELMRIFGSEGKA